VRGKCAIDVPEPKAEAEAEAEEPAGLLAPKKKRLSGYSYCASGHGHLVDTVRELDPDLIIMDIAMPKLDF